MKIILCDICKKEMARDYSIYGKSIGYTIEIRAVGSRSCDFSRCICKDCADKIETFIKENTKEFKGL